MDNKEIRTGAAEAAKETTLQTLIALWGIRDCLENARKQASRDRFFISVQLAVIIGLLIAIVSQVSRMPG